MTRFSVGSSPSNDRPIGVTKNIEEILQQEEHEEVIGC
jgi:hypothetical protein